MPADTPADTPVDTIEELFEMSIATEREAEAFYSSLLKSFSAHTASAGFFASMRDDERAHIKSIASMRDALTPEALAEPGPAHALQLIRTFLNFSATESLSRIKDLEDAYRMTVNLEFSELNKVHQLLVDLFAPSDKTRNSSEKMLKAHLEKVHAFHDATGETTDRRAVLPA